MTANTQNGFLTVFGKRLEFARVSYNPTCDTTLIFLHEGLVCVALWRDFPAKLAVLTGCRAFVYSRFGYGCSDPCSLPRQVNFMHDEGLTVLPRLLEKASIDKYILIGHSDGGSIALIHAGGAASNRLRGVITEAAHVSCEPFNLAAIKQAKENYLNTDLRQKLKKYHGANVDTAFWGWHDAWRHPEFIDWNIESFLPHIRIPVLAIQGEEDKYGTPAQLAAITDHSGAGAKALMLTECGHVPHRDREQTVLTAMNAFIKPLVEPLDKPSQ